MGKEKKSPAKSTKAKALSPEQVRRRRKFRLNILAIFAVVIGSAIGLYHLRQYVDQRLTFLPEPPHVVLKDRPAWMTEVLADQIVSTVQPTTPHSAFDQRALVNAYEILAANPWIKKVREVRRIYGKAPGDTIVIDCEYRAPVALVQWGDYYSLVDGEAIKLPEQFTLQQLKKIMFTSDGRMNIRLIQGVKHPSPTPGTKWPGDDLKAGLEMASILSGRSSAEEVLRIDVTNFAGRVDAREAQVVLLTREGSEIRWGRVPSAKDAFIEAHWERKLQYMDWLVREFKHVDGGHSWIDLRLDEMKYPQSEARSAAADDGK